MDKIIKNTSLPWLKSYSFCLFNKLNFYAGVSDGWGIGIEWVTYDRALTINFIKFYVGVELWYGPDKFITNE